MRDGKVADVRVQRTGVFHLAGIGVDDDRAREGADAGRGACAGERFAEMIRGDAGAAGDKALGQARALSGVSRFPTRVRCALIAWEAMARAAADPGS